MLILEIIAAVYVGIGLVLVSYYIGNNIGKKISKKPAFEGINLPEDTWVLILSVILWPIALSDLIQ